MEAELCKQHEAWVLDILLDTDKESDCFPAIQQSAIASLVSAYCIALAQKAK